MRQVFKTVLLWLLLLAVPFQGYAASAMLFCETSHHRTDTVPTAHADHQHNHDHHAKHDGSLISVDHHQHQPAADSPDDGSEKNGSQHNLSKCSACSTCCVGAAIAPTLMDFAAIPPSDPHLISFATVSFVGHIPGRLERPPSPFLA